MHAKRQGGWECGDGDRVRGAQDGAQDGARALARAVGDHQSAQHSVCIERYIERARLGALPN
jgi:hypothetical protein